MYRALRIRYEIPPRNTVPHLKYHSLWMNHFRAYSSVFQKRDGAQRTVRSPENIDRVRRSILQSPKRFVRKHASSSLALSNRTVHRILHENLPFRPYKMVITYELSQQDWWNRLQVCITLIQTLLKDVRDEVHIHISGSANMQNIRYRSGENP